MKNNDIRLAAAGAGVCLWQIADALGIADNSFSRKLRKELSVSAPVIKCKKRPVKKCRFAPERMEIC